MADFALPSRPGPLPGTHRRVNRKLVLALTLVTMGVVVVGVRFGVRPFVYRPSADWLQRGLALEEQGDLQRAAEAYSQAERLDPNNVEAAYAMAALVRKQGNLEAAGRSFRALVDNFPGHIPSLTAILEITVPEATGQFTPEAELMIGRWADQLLRVSPGNALALRVKAALLFALRDSDALKVPEALTLAQQAVANAPTNPQAALLLALIYRHMDEPGKGDEVMANFLKVAADAPVGPMTFARYLLATKQTPKAVELLESAMTRWGDNLDMMVMMAGLYDLVNRSDDSRLIWERVKTRDPASIQPFAVLSRTAFAKMELEEVVALCTEGLTRIEQQKSEIEKLKNAMVRSELHLRRGMALATQADRLPVGDPEREKLTELADQDLKAVMQARGPEVYSLMLAGQVNLLRGRRTEAIQNFEEARQRVPEGRMDPGLMAILGQLYVTINQPGKAFQLFDEVLKADPRQPLALRACVELLLMMDRAQDAEAYARRLLEQTPQDVVARRLLVNTVLNQDRAAEAQRLAEQLKIGDDAVIQGQILMWQIRKADRADVIAAFRRAADRRPTDPNLREQFVRYLIEQGEMALAREVLDKSLAALPDAANLKVLAVTLDEPTGPDRAGRLMEVARQLPEPFARSMAMYTVAKNVGNWKEAETYLAEAAKLRPEHAQVLEEQLAVYLAQQRYDVAEQVVQRAARYNVDGANGEFFRGRLLSTQGKLTEAVAAFERALRSFPNSSPGLTFYADTLLKLGSVSEAVDIYQRALAQNPRNPLALKGLAMATVGKDRRKGLELVRRALALAPEDPWLRAVDEEARDQEQPVPVRLEARRARFRDRPDDLSNGVALAGLLFRTQAAENVREAEQVLRECVKRFPQELNPLMQLCELLKLTRRTWEAEQLLKDYTARARTPAERTAACQVLARFYNQLGRFEDAEKVYAELVTQNPNSAALFGEYGECLRMQKKIEPALEQFRQAVALPGVQAEQYRLLGRALLEAGKLDEAEATLAEFNRRFPGDEKLPWLRALLSVNRKNKDEAISQLSAILAKTPDDPLALWQRAQFYSEQGQLALSIRDLQVLSEVDPRAFDYQPRLLLLDLLERTDDKTKARLEAQRLASEAMATSNNELALLVGVWMYRTKHTQEASDLIDQGLEKSPDDWRWHLMKGQIHMLDDQLEAALQQLLRAVDLNPQAVNAINTLTQVYLKLDQAGQAIATIDTARLRKVDSVIGSSLRAIALLKLNRQDEATREIRQGIAMAQRGEALFTLIAQMIATFGDKPTEKLVAQWVEAAPGAPLPQMVKATWLVTQGQIKPALDMLPALQDTLAKDEVMWPFYLRVMAISLQHQGELDRAQEIYRQLLQAAPTDVVALNNLAYLLASDLNRPEEAIPFIQRARDLDPTNANVLDTQGLVLLKAGRLEEAEKALLASLRLAEFPENRYHMGLVRMARRDRQGARLDFEKGLQLLDRNKNPRQGQIRRQIEDALAKLDLE